MRYDQGAVEFEVGGVNFKVRLNRVAESAGQVPKVGVPLSTFRRETRETLTKSPLAAWVYLMLVEPAFKTVATSPLIRAIVGSSAVALQAPGEFEVGGIRVMLPSSNFTLWVTGRLTRGKAASAVGAFIAVRLKIRALMIKFFRIALLSFKSIVKSGI